MTSRLELLAAVPSLVWLLCWLDALGRARRLVPLSGGGLSADLPGSPLGPAYVAQLFDQLAADSAKARAAEKRKLLIHDQTALPSQELARGVAPNAPKDAASPAPLSLAAVAAAVGAGSVDSRLRESIH